jgi:hypothetical protein
MRLFLLFLLLGSVGDSSEVPLKRRGMKPRDHLPSTEFTMWLSNTPQLKVKVKGHSRGLIQTQGILSKSRKFQAAKGLNAVDEGR